MKADVVGPPEKLFPTFQTNKQFQEEALTRVQIDRSCRQTVVWYFTSAVVWLLFGSLLRFLCQST